MTLSRLSVVTLTLLLSIGSGAVSLQQQPGSTIILPWQDGKRGAVSLTYDDASINQFRIAAPLMNERQLPGTFFVITSGVAGSTRQGRFIGRAPAEILRESAAVPTGESNYLERLSAAPFLGFHGLISLRTTAARPTAQTFARIDEAYARARTGALTPLAADATIHMDNKGDIVQEPRAPDVRQITWPELAALGRQGHEIGSHSITHPRLDALDEANIRYELEGSRDEIRERLGAAHTFSAECPFGIEDERVMEYALRVYPALRNRMPEPWLEEHNRSSRRDPRETSQAYVQWQRGLLSSTTIETARGWIDTAAGDDNIWLVGVIHGVEGIGWESVTRETLAAFFDHLVARRADLWIATFGDVTKYMRERMHGTVSTGMSGNQISVTVTHTLDRALYDLPLTLKTYVPAGWTRVRVVQGAETRTLDTGRDDGGRYVIYRAVPGDVGVRLSAA